MENWNLYVDLGYEIPKYAVAEILRQMRDNAVPDESGTFGWYVECNDGFGIGSNSGLGMCLQANSRCVGLELTSLQFKSEESGKNIEIHFNKRKKEAQKTEKGLP